MKLAPLSWVLHLIVPRPPSERSRHHSTHSVFPFLSGRQKLGRKKRTPDFPFCCVGLAGGVSVRYRHRKATCCLWDNAFRPKGTAAVEIEAPILGISKIHRIPCICFVTVKRRRNIFLLIKQNCSRKFFFQKCFRIMSNPFPNHTPIAAGSGRRRIYSHFHPFPTHSAVRPRDRTNEPHPFLLLRFLSFSMRRSIISEEKWECEAGRDRRRGIPFSFLFGILCDTGFPWQREKNLFYGNSLKYYSLRTKNLIVWKGQVK